MKRLLCIILFLSFSVLGFSQSNASHKNVKVNQKSKLIGDVTIGSSSFDASAILTVTSTTQGALMPRMNTTERDNISSPTDGLLIFNTQTNQYEFFESTWQAVGGAGNTIYSANDNLTSSRTVTLGANSLTFSGNQTSTEGIDATSSNTSFLAEDNAGTDLLRVRNDGKIIINTATTTGILSVRGTGITNATTSLYIENNTPTTTFFVDDEGNATLLKRLTLHQGVAVDNMISFFDANYKIGVLAGVLRFTSFANIELRAGATASLDEIQFTNSSGTVKAVLDAGTGNFGIGVTVPSSRLDVGGDVEINSSNAFYLGDPTTDGTWRIIRSGDDLLMQQRESGTYNTKQTISGA